MSDHQSLPRLVIGYRPPALARYRVDGPFPGAALTHAVARFRQEVLARNDYREALVEEGEVVIVCAANGLTAVERETGYCAPHVLSNLLAMIEDDCLMQQQAALAQAAVAQQQGRIQRATPGMVPPAPNGKRIVY